MADPSRLDAGDVARLLSGQIESLAAQLLPAARRNGPYLRCGSLAGEPGQSLAIGLYGARRGRWKDYASGESGDALDLVAAIVCGGDLRQALDWARSWLGLGRIDPDQADRLRRRSADAAANARHQAERQALRHRQDAKRVWLAAQPLAQGDFAWRYLNGRGVELERLPYLPRALRCHSGLWNAESGRAWPALVAAISGPSGIHANNHRIWLAERPNGKVGKAPLQRPKLSMPGGYAGGCVRLWRGAGGKPWRDMPEGETVLAGEGIEDVMTALCLDKPRWRAIAVLSISSLKSLVLPPAVDQLIWIAQNDPPGSPAAWAMKNALQAHHDAGRLVALMLTPRPYKDINDFVNG